MGTWAKSVRDITCHFKSDFFQIRLSRLIHFNHSRSKTMMDYLLKRKHMMEPLRTVYGSFDLMLSLQRLPVGYHLNHTPAMQDSKGVPAADKRINVAREMDM